MEVVHDSLLHRAQAEYEHAVRHPRSRDARPEVVAEARAVGAHEALVVGLRAQAWRARYALAGDEAKVLLDEAVRVARRAHLDDRLVEVLSTRAAVNLELGRGAAARRDLDRARAISGPEAPADLSLQLAVLDHNEGRLKEAATLYGGLLDNPSTPPDINIKAANNLALIESSHGDHTSALARLDDVVDLAAHLGPALEAVVADSRGWITVQSGRLVEGLRLLAVAADRHREAGLSLGEHYLEHCDALADLRLLPEAIQMAFRARDEFIEHGVGLLAGEAHVRVARLSALMGDHAAAEEAARSAYALFRRQRRPAWAAHARVLELAARTSRDAATVKDASALRRAAAQLEAAGMRTWAADAYLAAADVPSTGPRPGAAADLAAAERLSCDGPALQRLKGHLAGARRAELVGARHDLLSHSRAGLVDLAKHRAALSSAELRALASGHGLELGIIALRALIRDGTPAQVLQTMERTRAATMLLTDSPSVEGTEDLVLELRSVQEELAAARMTSGGEPPELVDAQRLIERRIRRASWLLPSSGTRSGSPVSLTDLRRLLGGRTMVEYAALDGELVAVVVRARRSELVHLGSLQPVLDEGRHLLFALRALAIDGRTPAATARLWAGAGAAIARLRELLLVPARLAAGEPVVVVPAAPTWRLPWAYLCAAPVSLAPSSAAWARAAVREEPVGGRVVLVAGPGLAGAADEVALLAGLHRHARVLVAPDSNVDAVIDSLDGARLAHLACHGRLRADNPAFSSFLLSAGELSVHELTMRDIAPHRVILSACDSGSDAAYVGNEFIGFVSALLGQGTSGLVASCVQVSDREVTPIMAELHRRLVRGDPLHQAIHSTVRGLDPENLQAVATGCAFSAYGAA